MKQGVHFRNTCQDFAKKSTKTRTQRLAGVYLASQTVTLLLSQASFLARAGSQLSVADRRDSSGWRKIQRRPRRPVYSSPAQVT